MEEHNTTEDKVGYWVWELNEKGTKKDPAEEIRDLARQHYRGIEALRKFGASQIGYKTLAHQYLEQYKAITQEG